MGAWLKKFWTDEQFFTGAIKTLVSMVGGLIASGIIPVQEWRYGFLLMAAAHMIPSGALNAPGQSRTTPQA